MISESTNIKNLPQIDQIINNDFLVVENFKGTNKLQFKDFVIGPTNTSFYTGITNDIYSLSSKDFSLEQNVNTNISSLSSSIDSINRNFFTLNTTVRFISSYVSADASYKYHKYQQNSLITYNPSTLTYNSSNAEVIVTYITPKIFNLAVNAPVPVAIKDTSLSIVSNNRPMYFGWKSVRADIIVNSIKTGYTFTFTVSCSENLVATDALYIEVFYLTSVFSFFS